MLVNPIITKGLFSIFATPLVLELILMKKRYTRGLRSQSIAYKSLSGGVRILISGQELSENTLELSQNGACPSANI